MKKITIIPAKNFLESKGKLKVAAYCRVSLATSFHKRCFTMIECGLTWLYQQ